MKFSPKALIIALCSVLGVAAVATTAVVLVNNSSKSGYTVHFELCTDLETTSVNDREVEAGAFLEEPEVYVTGQNEENWGIGGWYRDEAYEAQWDFDFDTVESDITLYAKWEKNPQCTVNFWTLDSDKAIYTAQIRKGLTTSRCDDKFIGREVLGYYTDKEMTKEYDFKEKVNKNLDLWVKLSDYVYFSPEAIMQMNLCGNQVEVTEYEATRSLNAEGDIVTVGGKNGAYFWIKNLELAMNGTSIIQIKARELNDNYNGLLTGYIMGNYTLNGEIGTAGNFGDKYTGSMPFGKSAEPDEDGFYTFTYNLSALTPGIVYDKMTGFRFGIVGTDKYTYEIKEIRTLVDEYAVSGDAFLAKDGINFNALHLNTFTLMGNAQTEMIGKELLSFGGPNGAYVYRKQLEIGMGDEQIVRVKAKGDLKGGALAMFFFGDYTINGKAGSTTDFTAQHRVTFVKESTDANGFTTYVADISSAIPGLKYKTIKGFRLDLYGEGTRTLQLKSVVSEAPNAEEKQIAADFNAKGINFKGAHLNKFLTMGGAEKEFLSNGDLKFSGENGAFIYYKNLNNTMGNEQKLRLTAKGDLKNGVVAVFLFGDYTENGKAGTTTDYTGKQRVTFTKEGVTADGYTTYVADLSTIASNFKFNTIKGLRLDLYGEGSRSLEIKSLKSFAPSAEEVEANKDFVANGIDFTGVHFSQFSTMGDAETKLLANKNFSFGGPNGALVHRKNLKITMGEEQYVRLTAKGDLNSGMVALFFFGKYTENGQPGVTTDYTAKHRVTFIKESTDAEGYTTYLADISSIPGMKYDEIHGLRIDLYGNDTRTIEIKSLKSYVPTAEEANINHAFNATGIHFTGLHFSRFTPMAGADTNLLANKDFSLGGGNGIFVHKKDGMSITLGDDQYLSLKAKGDLGGGTLRVWLLGDYDLNGVPGTSTDYGQNNTAFNLAAGATDADGYTEYTVYIGDVVPGLKYNKITGVRLDMYISGTDPRTIEVKSLDSYTPSTVKATYYVNGSLAFVQPVEFGKSPVKPTNAQLGLDDNAEIVGFYSDEECTVAYDFNTVLKTNDEIYVKANVSNEFYLSAADINNRFLNAPNHATKSYADGVFTLTKTGADTWIAQDGFSFDAPESQKLVMKAKCDGTGVIVRLTGTYQDASGNPQTCGWGTFYWQLVKEGEPDAEGYNTYVMNLKAPNGATTGDWTKITGFRFGLNGSNGQKLEVKEVKAAPAPQTVKYPVEYYVNGQVAYTQEVESGETAAVPTVENLKVVGQEIKGFYNESGFTTTFDHGAAITQATKVYVDVTNNLYFSAADINEKFLNAPNHATKSYADGVFTLTKTGADTWIAQDGFNFDAPASQKIVMTAKCDGTGIIVRLMGNYQDTSGNPQVCGLGTFYWQLTREGDPDAEGYSTYVMNLKAPNGATTGDWTKITGFRFGLNGSNGQKVQVKEIKVAPAPQAVKYPVEYYVNGQVAYTQEVESGKTATVPTVENLKIAGQKIKGFYNEEGFTTTFDHGAAIEKATKVYVDVTNYFYLSADDMNSKLPYKSTNGTFNLLNGDFVINKTAAGEVMATGENLNFEVSGSQKLILKAKLSTDCSLMARMVGDYYDTSGNPQTAGLGTFWWAFTAVGQPDADGYTTYEINLKAPNGGTTGNWTKITTFRIQISNGSPIGSKAEIKEISCAPAAEYTVKYFVDNQEAYVQNVDEGNVTTRPTVDQLKIARQSIVGFFKEASFTTPFDFEAPITANENVYVKYSNYFYLSAADMNAKLPYKSANGKFNLIGKDFVIEKTAAGEAMATGEGMNFDIPSSNKIVLRAKLSEGCSLMTRVVGNYLDTSGNPQTAGLGTFWWAFTAVGQADAEGYRTYEINLKAPNGATTGNWSKITTFRIQISNGSPIGSKAEIAEIYTELPATQMLAMNYLTTSARFLALL